SDKERTFGHTNFATESSGRRSVRLNSTGEYVEITSTVPTNSIAPSRRTRRRRTTPGWPPPAGVWRRRWRR
ncbi:hypothetical protein DLE01_00100, partial [Streptomyces sp. FT05W]